MKHQAWELERNVPETVGHTVCLHSGAKALLWSLEMWLLPQSLHGDQRDYKKQTFTGQLLFRADSQRWFLSARDKHLHTSTKYLLWLN